MRWAVFATAILVIVFLMAPLAQRVAVEANPYTFSPGVYVYSPTPEKVYWEPNVEISFKIILDNDLAQIDSFFYTLDNKARSPLTFTRGTEDHHVNYDKYHPNWETYTVNTITVHKTLNLTDGTHRIAVFAQYSDGTIESVFYRSITVDITGAIPCTPFIISPLNQATYNTTEVALTYTIEKEILWSYYSLDSIDNSDLKYFEGNMTLHSLSEGQHKLRLYVTANLTPDVDPRYGQPNYHSTHQTISFYVDTTPPKVSNLSVNDMDSGDTILSFTVDEEASWVGYSLDNQANATVTDDVVLGDLPIGSHNVTVYAEDTAGNMGVSEPFFFSVVEPFPTTLVLAPVMTGTVVGLGLLVYFKKRKH